MATVPGTVLSSYKNIGVILNPNYADNLMQISESFFNSNFWYRDEFEVPEGFKQDRLFLNFDGINWKANVYLNGNKIGRIEERLSEVYLTLQTGSYRVRTLSQWRSSRMSISALSRRNVRRIRISTVVS